MVLLTQEEKNEFGCPDEDTLAMLVKECIKRETVAETNSFGYDVPGAGCTCSFCSDGINGSC